MNYEDVIYANVYGNDYGDRLVCLSFEAPFLNADKFADTVWKELSTKFKRAAENSHVHEAFNNPQLINKLYEYYLNTRPELDAGFVAVSSDCIVGAYPKKPSHLEPWGGFHLSPDGHVPETHIFPCTARVLREFILERPSTDDFTIRVDDGKQVRYYHIDELRPTHSYQ